MARPTGPEDALPGEFALIARHFRPLAGPAGLGLADDAALLSPPPKRDLVLSVDAMVAGVHFLPDDPPDAIARKLLRVNLSDLAAKGATPLGYLLALSLPRGTTDDWLADFAAGLGADQTQFGIVLLGGDTTSTPGPLVASATVLGHVAPGGMLRRAGARAGDLIWVTGTIGDGALGLAVAQRRLLVPGKEADRLVHEAALIARYRLPRPRLGLAEHAVGGLAAIAHAGMDVSDGLVQDLGHLCRAGGVAATIQAEAVPLSPAAAAIIAADSARRIACLTGGDDYELLLAVPEARTPALRRAAAAAGIPIACIGRFAAGAPGVTVLDPAGKPIALARGGFSHF